MSDQIQWFLSPDSLQIIQDLVTKSLNLVTPFQGLMPRKFRHRQPSEEARNEVSKMTFKRNTPNLVADLNSRAGPVGEPASSNNRKRFFFAATAAGWSKNAEMRFFLTNALGEI